MMYSLLLSLTACMPGADAAPSFRLETAAGEGPPGTVESLAEDWSVALAGARPVPGGEVISLRRVGSQLPAWPRRAHLLFANGDRLAGEPAGCDGRTLRFRPAFAAPADAP